MAGLVQAISLGSLPPLMAGTVAGQDVWAANSDHDDANAAIPPYTRRRND
jgi:hypothetical protein